MANKNDDIVWDNPKNDEVVWDTPEINQAKQKPQSTGSLLSKTPAVMTAFGLGVPAAYQLAKSGAKGISTIGQGLSNLPKVTNLTKGDNFAKSIRSAFVQAHSDKIATFGKQIDQLSSKYPNQTVSFQTVVDDLNNNWGELTTEAKSVIKKTPYLKNMVGAEPKISVELPLAKSQEVINYMNTKVPPKIRFNNLEVVDTINNIRGSQLEAFPEMQGVRAEYKSFIEPYNQVKTQFKFGKLLNAIKNQFGGAEQQTAVEKILPKEIIKKMAGYKTAAKMAEIPSSLPFIGKTLKTVGGMFGYAPMALQAFEIWKLNNDPEAQYNAMLGGGELAPKGSFDREVQQGRVL